MTLIKHERGKVEVRDADCARRSCLHVHWSRYPSGTQYRKGDGAQLKVYPLVCVRREEHGCPSPVPEPAPK